MSAPTEDQLRTLWRHGVPLSKSWTAYAHPDLKARWDALAEPDPLGLIVTMAKDITETGKTLQASLQGAADQARAMLALRKQMQAAILTYIRDGHLFGYGYEPPRKLASAPVAIPRSLFAGSCDWDGDRLGLGGLEFINVRLTTRRYRNEILARSHVVAATGAQAKGRPGVGRQIEAAGRAMIAEGMVDPARSAKSHFPALRERLDRLGSELAVAPGDLHDETIRRYFAPLFNALKDAKKQ